jgi:hypothetical protein
MKWEPKLSISTIIHSGIVGYDNLSDASRYQMRGFIADHFVGITSNGNEPRAFNDVVTVGTIEC